jgi:hypothetical protein
MGLFPLAETLALRIIEWFLSINSRALSLTFFDIVTPRNSSMNEDTIIPECDTVGLPLPANR